MQIPTNAQKIQFQMQNQYYNDTPMRNNLQYLEYGQIIMNKKISN